MSKFTVSIHNINLADVREDPVDYAERLANIAERVREDPGRNWDLIGLNEARARRVGTYEVKLQEQLIPCVSTGTNTLAVACFAAHLRGGSVQDIQFQKGEIGVIAKQSNLEQVGPVKKRLIGYRFFGTLRRRVVGSRFRVKSTGHIIPFFSTHVSSFKDKWYTRDQARVQLEDLVSAIRSWWTRGDTTPVLVGDFNSDKWNKVDWAVLGRDFQKVGGDRDLDNTVEHIWIGRRSKFRHSSGSPSITRAEFLAEFGDRAETMSDHGVPYAELSEPGLRYLVNLRKKEIHDLDQEDPQPNGCQVSEIKQPEFFKTYDEAKSHGFDNCDKCLGGSNW